MKIPRSSGCTINCLSATPSITAAPLPGSEAGSPAMPGMAACRQHSSLAAPSSAQAVTMLEANTGWSAARRAALWSSGSGRPAGVGSARFELVQERRLLVPAQRVEIVARLRQEQAPLRGVLDRAQGNVEVLAEAQEAGLHLDDVLTRLARRGIANSGKLVSIDVGNRADLLPVAVAHVHVWLDASKIPILHGIFPPEIGSVGVRTAPPGSSSRAATARRVPAQHGWSQPDEAADAARRPGEPISPGDGGGVDLPSPRPMPIASEPAATLAPAARAPGPPGPGWQATGPWARRSPPAPRSARP